MYAAGNLPDHVTRYNHKNTSRWLAVRAEKPWFSWDGVITAFGMMMACAGLIVSAVFMLQMV